MAKVSCIVPTVAGREEFLRRAVAGLEDERRHVSDHEIEVIVVENEPSWGEACQIGADRASGEYLLFTADDIVPEQLWLPSGIASILIDNAIPVPMVCPVLVGDREWLDEDEMPKLPFGPVSRYPEGSGFFEDRALMEHKFLAPRAISYYPAVPFCSREQWERIGPMIPTHYGADPWFGHRAREAGYILMTNTYMRFWHYACQVGGDRGDWLRLDRQTFSLNIALPLYISGELAPHEKHPLEDTAEGRDLARAWYIEHVGAPYWEEA